MRSTWEVKIERAALWQNGYKPVPVRTNGKAPAGKGWTEAARQHPPQAVINEPQSDALNTGILCDGLRVIDVDVDDLGIAAEIQRFAFSMFGTAPIRKRSNSARFALLYRASIGLPGKRALNGNQGKVEILGHGQQLVAFGTHESGAEYAWDSPPTGVHVSNLMPVAEDATTTFLAHCCPLIGADVAKIAPVAPRAKPTPAATIPAVPVIASEGDKARAAKALRENAAELAQTSSGRNNKLNAIAYRMGRFMAAGHIERSVVEQALLNAAYDNGYERKRGRNPALATLQSGLNSGMLAPIESIPDLPPIQNSIQPTVTPQQPRTNNMTNGNGDKRRLEYKQLSQVKAERQEWLWKDYIPAGALTLLAGVGGAGKSTLCFNLAARISIGGQWPDGTQCPTAGNVLFYSTEDDVARTIKPRFMAAGANLKNVGIIEATRDEQGKTLPFNPLTDMQALFDAREAIGGLTAVFFDPIVSLIYGDINKANEVRRYLDPLTEFAEATGCAVIGITHFSKFTQGKNTTERALGSRAFSDKARMFLIAAKEADGDQRVFMRDKTNITEENDGFYYMIEPTIVYEGPVAIETTKIEWGEQIKGSSRSVLRTMEEPEEDEHGTKNTAAQHFLRTELANGPRYAAELIERAKQQQISDRTLRRVKKQIGVQTIRTGYGAAVCWSLPNVVGLLAQGERSIVQ